MKNHAIIPIFIPHIGCPCACVFCDQNRITARTRMPDRIDVLHTIDTWLSTISIGPAKIVEIAFFGGSFTAISKESQIEYLKIAHAFKSQGSVHRIRLSTRPDCIDGKTLELLADFQVDTIELGAQSFDDKVLTLSKRGHDAAAIFKASDLIKDFGFDLGLQLMVGLPGSSAASDTASANAAAALKPECARLYPVVVIEGTELAEMLKSGTYTPLPTNELIQRTVSMYRVLMDHDVNILRVGLKSTELIDPDADLSGNYHPAFCQLVESEIALSRVNELLSDFQDAASSTEMGIILSANSKWFNPLIGHHASNKEKMRKAYPSLRISYAIDNQLADGEISLTPSFS